jgi:hypothetical protein
MLWATILFIWELVGVDLDKAKDAGGYVGPIVTALKSPQAVPWVLLALVLYFLFKCSTEWAQCHVDRRKLRFARADFVSAWIVAVAAIALYIGQAISRVQFADRVASGSTLTSLLLTLAAVGIGKRVAVGFSLRRQRLRRSWMDLIEIGYITALILALGLTRTSYHLRGASLAVFVIVGVLLLIADGVEPFFNNEPAIFERLPRK